MSASYQMSLPSIVLTPLLLRAILCIAYLLTRLPLADLFFIASVEKSYSKLVFLSLALARSITLTVSASPLWFALNHSMREPGVPLVMSYSLSLVTEVTANLFA